MTHVFLTNITNEMNRGHQKSSKARGLPNQNDSTNRTKADSWVETDLRIVYKGEKGNKF